MITARGFTLIEVLVTVSIIAILAGIIYVSFGESRDNARNQSLKVELKEMQLAIETYRAQNDSYPLPNPSCDSVAGGQRVATDSGCSQPYIEGLAPQFTPTLLAAEDSANPDCDYEYRTDTGGNWYKLTAVNCLHNVDDVSGVGPDEALARCANTCNNDSPGDVCDPRNTNYYSSIAIYSLGGQCQ